MSQNKFTPGPWSVPHFADEKTACGCQYVFSDSQSGFGSIASVQFGGEDESCERAKANARLISAAPDMLAVLEAALDGVEGHHPLDADIHSWQDAARAAIAKARGDHEQA